MSTALGRLARRTPICAVLHASLVSRYKILSLVSLSITFFASFVFCTLMPLMPPQERLASAQHSMLCSPPSRSSGAGLGRSPGLGRSTPKVSLEPRSREGSGRLRNASADLASSPGLRKSLSGSVGGCDGSPAITTPVRNGVGSGKLREAWGNAASEAEQVRPWVDGDGRQLRVPSVV